MLICIKLVTSQVEDGMKTDGWLYSIHFQPIHSLKTAEMQVKASNGSAFFK